MVTFLMLPTKSVRFKIVGSGRFGVFPFGVYFFVVVLAFLKTPKGYVREWQPLLIYIFLEKMSNFKSIA